MTNKDDKAPQGIRATRRDLLRYFATTAGCFVVPASTGALLVTRSGSAASSYTFPQGIASADPQSDAVVLWTRVIGSDDDVPLTAQLARDEAFTEVIAETETNAKAALDHTVRVLVTELQPDRHYFYRFIAPDGSTSRLGRTRTAPAAGAVRNLNVAVFSCQDYELGYFTAYRRMMLDDQAAGEAQKIDVVMHVGDFIYETIRRPSARDDTDLRGNRISLKNHDGSARVCGPLPSGGAPSGRAWHVPTTLEDYRHLYRLYLTDPDLQAARAMYPFVQTWDDHEFKNDCWQSYHKEESAAGLKVAANQAWFEFIPAALSMGGRDVDNHHAQDFTDADVSDRPAEAFDDHYLSLEKNNLAAIESLTIFRSLRWGSTAEILMADLRSYRSPRGLPQELLTVGRHPYPAAPVDPELIKTLSLGRHANDGNPPDEVQFQGHTLPNPRKTAPTGSMLGRRQKAWLKERLTDTDAKWKVLGMSVGLMRHGFDDSFREGGRANGILWTDDWDGYPAERTELTTFIKDKGIGNVVSLCGDRHLHMAGLVNANFDSPGSEPTLIEFAGGAVSAPVRLSIQRRILSHDKELEALAVFDGKAHGHEQALMPSMNAWMLYGAASAKAVHDGKSEGEAIKLADSAVNEHLKYVDADAHGYYVMRFDGAGCRAEFVVIEEPTTLLAVDEAPIRRRINFSANVWSDRTGPSMKLESVSGEPPLGGLKS